MFGVLGDLFSARSPQLDGNRVLSDTHAPTDAIKQQISLYLARVTPQTQVFGVRLSGESLPPPVASCVTHINTHSICEEGIYRVPGSKARVNLYRAMYDAGEDVELVPGEMAGTVTSLLCCFLREIPGSVFTQTGLSRLNEYRNASKYSDSERVGNLIRVVNGLPPANRLTLYVMVLHLNHVVHYREHNLMGVENLSLCVFPFIFDHVLLLMNNADAVFGEGYFTRCNIPLSLKASFQRNHHEANSQKVPRLSLSEARQSVKPFRFYSDESVQKEANSPEILNSLLELGRPLGFVGDILGALSDAVVPSFEDSRSRRQTKGSTSRERKKVERSWWRFGLSSSTSRESSPAATPKHREDRDSGFGDTHDTGPGRPSDRADPALGVAPRTSGEKAVLRRSLSLRKRQLELLVESHSLQLRIAETDPSPRTMGRQMSEVRLSRGAITGSRPTTPHTPMQRHSKGASVGRKGPASQTQFAAPPRRPNLLHHTPRDRTPTPRTPRSRQIPQSGRQQCSQHSMGSTRPHSRPVSVRASVSRQHSARAAQPEAYTAAMTERQHRLQGRSVGRQAVTSPPSKGWGLGGVDSRSSDSLLEHITAMSSGASTMSITPPLLTEKRPPQIRAGAQFRLEKYDSMCDTETHT